MATKGKEIKPRGKQAPWLFFYLDPESGGFLNATESARLAGYKDARPEGLQHIGWENKRKLEPLIAKWLDDHAFSETALKLKHQELMEAKKSDEPDNPIRIKALDMAYRIKGAYAADKIELTGLDRLAERLATAHVRTEKE